MSRISDMIGKANEGRSVNNGGKRTKEGEDTIDISGTTINSITDNTAAGEMSNTKRRKEKEMITTRPWKVMGCPSSQELLSTTMMNIRNLHPS
eukprot:9165158-Ditylum_brightwellii.AAC.1